jgi:hypothetical protein
VIRLARSDFVNVRWLQFQAIGEDPDKFKAFVNAAESAYQLRHEQLAKPFPDFFGATLQA